LSVAITQASCGGDSASAKESCTPLALCSVNGASAASVAGSAAYAARVACSSALAGAAVRAAPLLALPIALELFGDLGRSGCLRDVVLGEQAPGVSGAIARD
jgi:hypothetical protein